MNMEGDCPSCKTSRAEGTRANVLPAQPHQISIQLPEAIRIPTGTAMPLATSSHADDFMLALRDTVATVEVAQYLPSSLLNGQSRSWATVGIPEKWCGRDIEAEFMARLQKAVDKLNAIHESFIQEARGASRITGERGDMAILGALGHREGAIDRLLIDNCNDNGLMDFSVPPWTTSVGRSLADGTVVKCPTNCDKERTVSMCGICMGADTPGNLAYGFLSQLAGQAGRSIIVSFIDAYGFDDDQDTLAVGHAAAIAFARSDSSQTAMAAAVCAAVRKLKEQGSKHIKNCKLCPPK